ncbi:carboxypeptidase-like regulatory domain-containing protein [Sphingobacterium composti Ten et al. 2007 non Yoo et al. 2007]|uniref:carboxypeptidase-like regulatory domain-containing protein n=1 Tax=Sphingobacterium composti TaxID=363260 RepID=UPI001358BC09|nr:carboxypeptidase-like regulatory domain-containing protein [Sphingobacterium composti Ten et al. 2007 non Yoo et al. 2007]
MKIKIPQPCTESYEKMSPSELGRMCKVCNTEVVDFTNWETKYIVTYIQKSNERVCGRLSAQSTEAKITISKNWLKYVAAALTFCISNSIVYALNDVTNNLSSNNPIHSSYMQDSIHFEFMNKHNQNLPQVNLTNTKTSKKYITDNKGKVTIPYEEKSEFKITYIGYKTQFIKIKKSLKKNDLTKIILEEDSYEIGEVIVEPRKRIKPKFNKEINTINQIEQQKSTPILNSRDSIKQKLKRLFNIFSVKDEE